MHEQVDMELEQALLEANGRHGRPVPLTLSVADQEAAYGTQRRLAAVAQMPVMVWKIGLTGAAGRAAFGAVEPVVGRLPASAIYSQGSTISPAGPELYAEAELVFEIGQDLPAQDVPYTREQVIAAVRSIYAGIEIVRTRFASSDLTLDQLVADNVMAHGLVLGRRLAPAWDERYANLPVSLLRHPSAGPTERADGGTAQVMGNPLDALLWLANWLRMHEGASLRREQLVASGTCTGATPIFAGDTVCVHFDGVDSARVTLDR